MALLGAASISGVPPFGLPKINSLVGGIFIPTSRVYQLGEEVFMLLSLMDDPQRIAVQGKVVWITPEGVQGNRTQGIGVQFTHDETGASARATIEKVLAESLASNRPTHTM